MLYVCSAQLGMVRNDSIFILLILIFLWVKNIIINYLKEQCFNGVVAWYWILDKQNGVFALI